MTENESEVIRISRLLTPDDRADLLSWVHLAYFAENSARKSLGIDAAMAGVSISEPQDHSCGKLLQRSEK
jgi:hypothetical protein